MDEKPTVTFEGYVSNSVKNESIFRWRRDGSTLYMAGFIYKQGELLNMRRVKITVSSEGE